MDAKRVLPGLAHPDLEQVMNANLGAYWTGIGQHVAGTSVFSDSSVAWLSSALNIGYFNLVVPLRLDEADQDEVITDSIARAKNHQVSTMWWVSPAAIENGLGERLEAHGFAEVGSTPGMAVELANLNESSTPPANFEIRRVENENMLAEWVDTVIGGWPLPESWIAPFLEGLSGYGLGADLDLRHYVGYFDGLPVTASSVFFAAGVAGIYAVATRAEFRGRGLGGQITLRPLLEARQAGYQVGILQASELGQPVYRRLGFEDIFRYQVFQWSTSENA